MDLVYVNHASTGERMAIYFGINLYDYFILDTGANNHLVGRKDLYVCGTYEEINGSTSRGIGDAQVKPEGRGTIELPCRVNNGPRERVLQIPDVQYAPNAGVNLLSLGKLWPFIDTFKKIDKGLHFTKGKLEFSATLTKGLLTLDTC